jgi:VWFA-related protein
MPGRMMVVLAIVFLAFPAVISHGQVPSAPQQSQESPRFRVATDGVRIDAVVTDKDGRIVPDLTAEDFEVRQDGKIQKLLFAQFVPVLAGPPPSDQPAKADVARVSGEEHVPSPVRSITREDVQRTLAIVVDDLSLSFESFQAAQRALHEFIDRKLSPTDLVALVRTGGSMGAAQPFTVDRRVLHNAIDRLRWNGLSRNGVESYQPVNLFTTFDRRGSEIADPDDFKMVDILRRSISAQGTFGALNLAVLGARDLPGRKALIFVSEGFQMLEQGAHDNGAEPNSRLRQALDRVIEQATRAGVVIYSLDCRGLQSATLQASDDLKSGPLRPDGFDELIRKRSLERTEFNRDTQEGMAYLAEQTGGFAVLNTSNLGAGLGRITNDVRDYYVIGYTPAEGTFAPRGKKPSFHKITIKVRRPGLQVRTRKEFLGISDPAETHAPDTPVQQLLRAATSPFAAASIALRATTLPGYSPDKGAFVRTLLHIDASALTFLDDSAGRKTASADVLGMVFDPDGLEVAHLSTGFSVALTREGAEDALRDGLAYTLRIPIRRPGAYQLRFAVRDRQSGAIGSAGEFVEIPDTPGGAFALSGIVMRSDADPSTPGFDGADQITVTPAQAVRVYPRGTQLSYAYEIYNATAPVQSSVSIWRGAQTVLAVPPNTLVPPPATRVFAAAGGLKLGEALSPGVYILQIAATTGDASGKGRAALQRIDFEVR